MVSIDRLEASLRIRTCYVKGDEINMEARGGAGYGHWKIG